MSELLATVAEPAPPSGGGRRTARYLGSKLGDGLVSLFLVAVLGFFLFRVMPGDPVRTMTRGAPVSEQQIAALRERFGLDQPVWKQFLDFLGNLLRGDLGTSYTYSRPVGELILERIGPTVLLVGTATGIAVLRGCGWGLARRGGTAAPSTRPRPRSR